MALTERKRTQRGTLRRRGNQQLYQPYGSLGGGGSKPFGESNVSKILDLVENASSKKAEAENFITKLHRYYTPIVVICAAALAIIPPLFLGGWSD